MGQYFIAFVLLYVVQFTTTFGGNGPKPPKSFVEDTCGSTINSGSASVKVRGNTKTTERVHFKCRNASKTKTPDWWFDGCYTSSKKSELVTVWHHGVLIVDGLLGSAKKYYCMSCYNRAEPHLWPMQSADEKCTYESDELDFDTD